MNDSVLSAFFSHPCSVTPTPTNAGCDFSLCGIKSNLSDFSYDGLKQVSVFKVLKVTFGLMESKNRLHVWVTFQRLVMMSR